MSNRRSDTRGEKALGLFLDRYFYPRLCELEGLKRAQRVFDANEQKLGADILLTDHKGVTVVVDEKSQLHYINDPKKTFAFEISYYSDKTGALTDGWFISRSNKTDYYILVWIDSARNEKLNRIVEEDFDEATVALVSKRRIIHYLTTVGYSVDRIVELSKEIRTNERIKFYKLSNDAFLYYTKEGYEEKPINMVVNKTILYDLAIGVYKVSRKSCMKINK